MEQRMQATLASRIDRLERDNRFLKRATAGSLGASAVAVAAALTLLVRGGIAPSALAQTPGQTPAPAGTAAPAGTPAAAPQQVVAQQVLAQQVAAQQVAAPLITTQQLTILDRRGASRAVLGTQPIGTGAESRDVPSFVMTDESGAPIVGIYIFPDSANLNIFDASPDPTQRTRASMQMGVTQGGQPLLQATDAAGNLVIRVPAESSLQPAATPPPEMP
jgi:hypothetical protein